MKSFFRLLVLPFLLTVAFAAIASGQQIHIKARFLEVPKTALDLLKPLSEFTNGIAILSAASSQKLLHALESKPGFETLAEPEVITISGRQVEMRSTQIINVVTNFSFQETGTNGSIVPQAEPVETGPILDTIPNVLSDGYTIDLRTTASLTEFLGYDQPPTNAVGEVTSNSNVHLPVVLPSLRGRKASAHVKLYDGQTLALYKFSTNASGMQNQPKQDEKQLLVLVTVTLVDPAGNRIHTDDEMPFAKDAIPPQ